MKIIQQCDPIDTETQFHFFVVKNKHSVRMASPDKTQFDYPFVCSSNIDEYFLWVDNLTRPILK
jgi:sensor histidine kinase regulating citrate/malate metabolism